MSLLISSLPVSQAVWADLEADWPEPHLEWAAHCEAQRRGIKRRVGVSGYTLRHKLGSTPAARQLVPFRGYVVKGRTVELVRIGRQYVPVLEAVARLAGAVQSATHAPDCPAWLLRELTGAYPQPFHRYGQSRTLERMLPQYNAWLAVLAAGGSWGRLFRRVVAIQYAVAERIPSVRVGRREAIAQLAHGRGVKGSVRAILRGRIQRKTERAIARLTGRR